MSEEQKQNSKNSKVVVILALLVLSLLGNVFQAIKSSSYKAETVQKIEGLTDEYNNISTLYDQSMEMVEQYKADNQEMSADLEAKVKALQKLKEEVEQLKKTEKDQKKLYAALQRKFAEIQKLNKELNTQINALLEENKMLVDKNDSLRVNVEVLSEEAKVLSDKVNTGARLRAEYFKVVALKERWAGDGFKETDRARRTRKLEVTFDLLDNQIAEPGEKTVYLSIITPNGKVLGASLMGKNLVELENMNGKVSFTKSKEFTFTGKKQSVTMSYTEENEEVEFEEGTYKLEVYVDNYVSGKASFDLK